MRKIEFRVYIPDHEKFTYFELGNFDYSDRYLHQYEYPVQQSTGRKDSHGVMIYEGDLLEYTYLEDGKHFVGEVRYFENYGSFVVVVGNAFESFPDLIEFCTPTSLKVIGNIIENKDKNYV